MYKSAFFRLSGSNFRDVYIRIIEFAFGGRAENRLGQGVFHIFHRVFHKESKKGNLFYVNRKDGRKMWKIKKYVFTKNV